MTNPTLPLLLVASTYLTPMQTEELALQGRGICVESQHSLIETQEGTEFDWDVKLYQTTTKPDLDIILEIREMWGDTCKTSPSAPCVDGKYEAFFSSKGYGQTLSKAVENALEASLDKFSSMYVDFQKIEQSHQGGETPVESYFVAEDPGTDDLFLKPMELVSSETHFHYRGAIDSYEVIDVNRTHDWDGDRERNYEVTVAILPGTSVYCPMISEETPMRGDEF